MQLIDAEDPLALTELGHRRGWLTPGLTINRLTVPGAGNMNRVLRAHLNDGTTLIVKQALNCVAKYPDIPAPIERGEAELAFYQAIEGSPIAHACPSVLAHDPQHHLLVIEDLGDAQDLLTLYTPNTAERERALNVLPEWVSWLDGLHGLDPSAFTLSNANMRALNHEHIFDIPFHTSEALLEMGLEMPKEILAAHDTLVDSKLRSTAARLGRIYLGTENSGTTCLLHGDFYPGSWLHGSKASVIDPEFGFVGPAEFDLGVMQAHLMMACLDDQAIAQLLAKYSRDHDSHLVRQFTGIEIMRRIWGVARLPLTARPTQQCEWLTQARDWLDD